MLGLGEGADGVGAGGDGFVLQHADGEAGLRGQYLGEVGVGHRRQRVVALG
jgi:hypothetical protein